MKNKSIAVTGKGGVGKTLVAGLLIKFLSEIGGKSILGIDADPDSNLAESLGVGFEKTIGDIREDLLSQRLLPGVEKKKYLDAKVFEITIETDRFDLLVMGRPEGPGCYCAVNHMLREIIDSTTKVYDYVIIDAEAGLEHLSRRTTENVTSLVVVTDASKKGLQTAERIKKLANDLDIKFKEIFLILNKVKNENRNELKNEAEKINLKIIGLIPEDPIVEEYDLKGKPIINLPENSKAYQEVKKIAEILR